MPIALVETVIGPKVVRMRFADADEPPAEWIEVQMIPDEYLLGNLRLSEHADRMPLAATRLATLQRAQRVIAAEIARLKGTAGISG